MARYCDFPYLQQYFFAKLQQNNKIFDWAYSRPSLVEVDKYFSWVLTVLSANKHLIILYLYFWAAGSSGASNNMKNIILALIIALVFQHGFS